MGLAGATERLEQQTRSHPSEREKEKPGDAGTWKKWEGETKRRGSCWISVLCLSGAFPPLSFSFCLSFSSHSPLTQLFCLPVHFLQSLLGRSLFCSACPKPLTAGVCHSPTFCPHLGHSLDGLRSLLSSSCLLQPLFSQDASLQGVLHQNGSETVGGLLGFRWCKCFDFL